MTMPAPEPIEEEPAKLGLCAEKETAVELQKRCDAEHGYPKQCKCRNGADPPLGVPRMILHAFDLDPIVDERVDPPVVVAWSHPLPRAALEPALAAKVEAKTHKEIQAMKAERRLPMKEIDVDPQPRRTER